MLVKMKTVYHNAQRYVAMNAVVDLPEKEAKDLIAGGYAEEVKGNKKFGAKKENKSEETKKGKGKDKKEDK